MNWVDATPKMREPEGSGAVVKGGGAVALAQCGQTSPGRLRGLMASLVVPAGAEGSYQHMFRTSSNEMLAVLHGARGSFQKTIPRPCSCLSMSAGMAPPSVAARPTEQPQMFEEEAGKQSRAVPSAPGNRASCSHHRCTAAVCPHSLGSAHAGQSDLGIPWRGYFQHMWGSVVPD